MPGWGKGTYLPTKKVVKESVKLKKESLATMEELKCFRKKGKDNPRDW